MFKYVYFLLALILFGCKSKEQKNFTIQGEISGAENKMYYLYELGDTIPLLLDSALIENTQLYFNTNLNHSFNLLGIGTSQQNLMLMIAEPKDKLTITASQKELPFKYTVEGSKNSIILQKYIYSRSEIYIKNNQIQKKMKSLSYDAHEERERLIQNAISIKEEYNSLKYNFIENNKNSPVIFIALFDIVDNLNEYRYLKMIESSISTFLPHTVFPAEINLRIKKADLEQANLARNEAQIQQQKQEMINSGIEVGKEAPELNFPNMNGQNISLSSLKGKIVLLDFWASWCGPCRKENPFVVSLYNKYKDKGFDIYSFSLDNKKEKWEQAIKQDGLIWGNHVSDLMGWQSVGASKYMIRSIPQTFLIDKNGKIIDIGLRGAQLEKRLKELLET